MPVLTFVSGLFTQDQLDVRVRRAVVIPLSQVKGTDHVDTNIALRLLHQQTLDNLIRLHVDHLAENLQVSQLHLSHKALEKGASLVVEDSAGKSIESERLVTSPVREGLFLVATRGNHEFIFIRHLDVVTVGALTLPSVKNLGPSEVVLTEEALLDGEFFIVLLSVDLGEKHAYLGQLLHHEHLLLNLDILLSDRDEGLEHTH